MGTGGARDGAGRPGWRRKCEQSLPFDIRQLKRRGLLKPGQSFVWRWLSGDQHIGSIEARVEIDRVVLSYQHKDRPVTCTLWLVSCAGGYGARPAFRCPCCGRRTAIVYSGGSIFACRWCLKLVYASEAEGKISRLWRKQGKIEKLLADDGDKPKWMHWQTFERLSEKIGEIEQERCSGLDLELERLMLRWNK